MYDFTQDFTDYQKLVPNADLTVKTPSTVTTQTQGYDFNKDLESYRKIAPEDNGLSGINDALKIKALKQQQAEEQKRTEEDKKKLQLAADLQLQSGYTPTPESVSSAQMTEGAKKNLAGMQDKILGKTGVITQRFGNRNAIEKFSGGVNYGTDIGVPKGTKVSVPPGKWKVIEAYAGAEEGKSAVNRGYGNSILVQNQETGEKMRFSHLQDVGVRPNEIIDGNKIVGTVGLTGNTTGPHLDLEMYDRSGRLIDILNTPYSSYLGLGQGGGSEKGGGNPLVTLEDTFTDKTVSPLPDSAPKKVVNTTAELVKRVGNDLMNGFNSVGVANPLTNLAEYSVQAKKPQKEKDLFLKEQRDKSTNLMKAMGYVTALPETALVSLLSLGAQQVMGKRPFERGDYAKNIADTVSQSSEIGLSNKVLGKILTGLDWTPVSGTNKPIWLARLMGRKYK